MDLRLDDLGVGNLKIWQDKDLFCFGTDAVLLANFACPKNKDKLLDIGTGNGIIPLLLTAKSNVSHITGLEIQHASFTLAEKNVAFNNLTHKIEIIEGDIKDTSLFPAASFSYITCNPPYKPVGTGLKNPDSPLAIARHELLCTLEDIISRAAYLLHSKGKLALVHKPERAAQIIYLMKKNRIEPKRILTVHARASESPCLILIEGMKDGNEGINWEEPLTIYDENGVYTAHCNMLYQKTKEKKSMNGVLYLVATPIGNLTDISERALEVLKMSDFVAAEDTRHTLKLLNHFGIKKPMISYFEHNKLQRGEIILARILEGENCALVTDAGTPAISDPGEDLVRQCAEAGVDVIPIPGPCAFVQALIVSGLPTGRFSFEGFLSVTKNSRKEHLESVKTLPHTLIFYEAPHKLLTTLKDLLSALGNRKIAVVREITKIHEEVLRTDIESALNHFTQNTPKGEFVLVVEGYIPSEEEEGQAISEEIILQKAQELLNSGMSKKDVSKELAALYNMPKNVIYKLLHS